MTCHNYLSHKPHRRIRRQQRQTGRQGQRGGGGQWRWTIAATFYWRVKSTATTTTAITEIAHNIIYIMFQLSTKNIEFFKLEVTGLINLWQSLNEICLFIFKWRNCFIKELLKFVYFQTTTKHRCHFTLHEHLRLILLLIVKQNIGFCHYVDCSAVTFDILNQNVIT